MEDDLSIRRLLVTLLSSAGYDAPSAVDGPDALAYFAEQRPDAVFLDVSLPGMSGWDVFASIRSDPNAPPVVLLTADQAAVNRARREGAHAILKPFDIDEVLNVVDRLVGPSNA